MFKFFSEPDGTRYYQLIISTSNLSINRVLIEESKLIFNLYENLFIFHGLAKYLYNIVAFRVIFKLNAFDCK